VLIPSFVPEIEHWMAFFVDVEENGLRHGDALARNPSSADLRRIQRFVDHTCKTTAHLKPSKLKMNHQHNTHSCAITVCDLFCELTVGSLPWVSEEADLRRSEYTLILSLGFGITSPEALGMTTDVVLRIKNGLLSVMHNADPAEDLPGSMSEDNTSSNVCTSDNESSYGKGGGFCDTSSTYSEIGECINDEDAVLSDSNNLSLEMDQEDVVGRVSNGEHNEHTTAESAPSLTSSTSSTESLRRRLASSLKQGVSATIRLVKRGRRSNSPVSGTPSSPSLETTARPAVKSPSPIRKALPAILSSFAPVESKGPASS
jgi:hypothetical protein